MGFQNEFLLQRTPIVHTTQYKQKKNSFYAMHCSTMIQSTLISKNMVHFLKICQLQNETNTSLFKRVMYIKKNSNVLNLLYLHRMNRMPSWKCILTSTMHSRHLLIKCLHWGLRSILGIPSSTFARACTGHLQVLQGYCDAFVSNVHVTYKIIKKIYSLQLD